MSRKKFVIGQTVRLNVWGRRQKVASEPWGTVVAFCRNPEMIRVRVDGTRTAQYFHRSLWIPWVDPKLSCKVAAESKERVR